MNDKELHDKVHSAMYALIKEKGVASPVEVLMMLGVLSKDDYENWRNGKVTYLERICKINLSKLTTISREIRAYAKKNDLKPSYTMYKQWAVKKKNGQGCKPVIKLRFSKSGDEKIERAYATHYVSQHTVETAKERKAANKKAKEHTPHIKPVDQRDEATINNLLAIWESSVMETHTFLSEVDIFAIKPDTRNGLESVEKLYSYSDENGEIQGFIGVKDDKIEMLFIGATARGQGIGRQLLSFAVADLGARFVDVNEQNEQGVGFYRHMGFIVTGRSELDEQGRPFPILHLKVQSDKLEFIVRYRRAYEASEYRGILNEAQAV